MKTFNSRAIALATGASAEATLVVVDKLLRDQGLEVVMVNTDRETLVIIESTITETVVMESPPTNTLDLSQKKQFQNKSRLPA